MHNIDAFDYVFALVGCRAIPVEGAVGVEEICGTAFSIGNSNFIAAGHSIQSASEHALLGLGQFKGGSIEFHTITDWETVDAYDVGFVKADIAEAKSLNWDFDQLVMLEDVLTVGFPHSLDSENLYASMRGLKGYVVSKGPFFRLPHAPRCYELSFQCPVGLSGAPLLTRRFPLKVKGVIIGNQSSEMVIYSEKEVLKEDKERIVERSVATQFGIAIQTASLREVDSRILGGSLEQYLKSAQLV